MTWCNLVPIFRSIWVNVPIKEGRHGSRQSNAFPTLHPIGTCYITCDKIPPAQVLEWISLLHEAWSLTTSTASSLDCQKRAVCEIWRWTWIWMSSFGMYYFIHSMDWLTVKMYTNSCDVCSKIVGSNLVSLFLRYLLLLPWTRPENKMYHTDKMDLVFKV